MDKLIKRVTLVSVDDKPSDWQKRYDDYYDALRATGWTAADDRDVIA